MTPVLASLRGLVRRFGPVTALAGADLEVNAGEVHGVLGENGAGKTTLLGVLGGVVRPDEGEIEISGRRVELRGPRDAWRHGVGLVHQHFTLVPPLTVLENLSLGRDADVAGWSLPQARVRVEAEALMARTGLQAPLDEPVENLGVGDRQRVEILKALLREPPILVLDEPTAVLTPSEVDSLFELLEGLAEQGRAVVLVAHKIEEVLAVADRVTVLRRGRTVLSSERSLVDAAVLVAAMVGQGEAEGGGTGLEVAVGVADAVGARVGREPGEVVSRLERVGADRASGARALHDVDLVVRRGEVVGIAGVEGNGQRELALVLSGRMSPRSGTATVPMGVGFIPQDRSVEGVVADFDLVENMALALHDAPEAGRGIWLDWARVRDETEDVVRRFGVVTPGVGARAGGLSGGNQQRLVVGREMRRARDLLVAENPTRGLDVAATAFVHSEILRIASEEDGPGVVLVSTDLDEVLALATRVLVLRSGRLLPVPDDARSRSGVGELMLVGTSADA